jgi:hypothetical protein
MQKQKSNLDVEIDHVIDALNHLSPDADAYGDAVKNLEVLMKVRDCRNTPKISYDTIIIAATNILGIVLIMSFEQIHVIGTKAIGFVLKGRV